VDHLLLHCHVAFATWSALFTRFGMSWVMPSRVIDLFAYWWTFERLMSVAIGKMVPTCVFGAYGRNKITGVSRTWRGHWRIFLLRSFILHIFGWWLLRPYCRLVLMFSWFAFLFLVKVFPFVYFRYI
jgi:hypothetical protein